jgi:uncharacterized protein (TIRG00374 family)
MDLKKLLPIIGIALFIYIIINVGVDKIVNTFTIIPFYFFIIAITPYFLRLPLTSYKWKYIAKKQKMDFTLTYLIKINLICTFYRNVTPGGLGGYLRIFYLRKKSKASLEKCIVNMLLDIVTGSTSGFLLAAIGAIIFMEALPGVFYVFFIYLVLNTGALVIFIKKHSGSKILKIFIRPFIPKKYKEKIDNTFEKFYEDIPKLKDLIIPYLTEFVIWALLALQVYIISLPFSLGIPFHIFFFIHTISSAAIMILPITVAGLGIREGVFVILLSTYGIAPEIAVVISLSGFIVKMIIPTSVGMIMSLKKESIL